MSEEQSSRADPAERWLSDSSYGQSDLLTSWRLPSRKFVSAGTGRIQYVEVGSGPNTVLLLHGLGNSWEIWLPLLDDLARNARVIALDLPGFGRSDGPATEFTVEGIAATLEELWPKLDLGRPAILGHSLGGLVACSLAARDRVPVQSIAVVDGTLVAPIALGNLKLDIAWNEPLVALRGLVLGALVAPPVPRQLRSLLLSQRRIADFLLSLCLRDPSRINGKLLEAVLNGLGRGMSPRKLRGLFGFDLKTMLSRITVPALFIHGSDDQVVSRSDLEYFLAAVPHADGVVLHRGAHWIMLEYPDAVLETLHEFWE